MSGTEKYREWLAAIEEVCAIDGCDKPVRVLSRGWCNTHYQRWRKTGDPLQAHHEYRTENVGYAAVHTRLRNWRGLANEHLCIVCGRRAVDWSYEGCDDERVDKGMRYCVHIEEHYRPRCRKCHVALRRYTP